METINISEYLKSNVREVTVTLDGNDYIIVIHGENGNKLGITVPKDVLDEIADIVVFEMEDDLEDFDIDDEVMELD